MPNWHGLEFGNPKLIDVKYDESHDGPWWKKKKGVSKFYGQS